MDERIHEGIWMSSPESNPLIIQVRQPGISLPNVMQTASPREHQSKEVNQNLTKAFRKVTDINNEK